eukprot:1430740-Pyramimonas_sp.AAC.2
MDDDIMFTDKKKAAKPLDKFEAFLEEYQPAVGTVSIPERDGKKVLTKGIVWPVCAFDALFNAFHHEAVDVLLPYDQRYEQMSWYCSQQDIIIRTSAMYKNHVLVRKMSLELLSLLRGSCLSDLCTRSLVCHALALLLHNI